KLPGHTDRCHFGLAMTAGQANGSHLLDVSLFRDFILADCKRTRYNRSAAPVTGVDGEMKVLFSHCAILPGRPTERPTRRRSRDLCNLRNLLARIIRSSALGRVERLAALQANGLATRRD
ncbi:MAG TPA: hypothetical protein VFV92_14135, partial [Candidatus Bathyarchaeia archaeon]|nr:hypothetical protein [Candidatus Bathyarchaeia archaeon]